MNRLLFLIGLAGLALMPLKAGAAAASCVVAADHPLMGTTRWYGLYYQDRKIGHAKTAMKLEALRSHQPDEQRIVQQFAMTFKLEQTEETIEQTRRFAASPPHQLLDGSFRSADRFVSYEQVNGDLQLDEDGVKRIWLDVDRDLCDEEDIAIHQFLEQAPPIGARLETADFDVEHQVLLEASHRLEEISTRRILGAYHVFQTLQTASSSEVFSYSAKARFQNGEAVNLFLGPMELRAETEAIAHRPNQGVDLFAEFEKPLNQPLPALSSIKTLTLKAQVDDESVTIDQVVIPGFGQHVEYLDAKTAIVTISGDAAPAEEVDTARFLTATSSHPADHPRLVAIADDIRDELDTHADDRTLALALLDFVADYIENVPESPYAYHTTSVLEVLDKRSGDCTEHSQLFVTLARSAGLPAREVSGFVYGGDDGAPSLSGHAWVEVLIDGQWIGMDPTWGESELNRSHVQVRNVLDPSLTFEVLDIVQH